MASSCSQRQTLLPLMLATKPVAQAWRASSGALQRDNGCCSVAGNSQARALTCTTTSGGKRPGAPGSWEFLQPAEPLGEKAFAPQADDFAAGVQALGQLGVGEGFRGPEDHLCLGGREKRLTGFFLPAWPVLVFLWRVGGW